MPFAVTSVLFFVLLALTIPSQASQSCMARAEAREHFGSVHLYSHSRDRCWDTVPTQKAFRTARLRRTIDQYAPHQPPSKAAYDELVQTRLMDRWAEFDRSQYPALARWIEMVEVASPLVEPKVEPALTPRGVILVVIAIVLTLATIEVLFRCTIS